MIQAAREESRQSQILTIIVIIITLSSPLSVCWRPRSADVGNLSPEIEEFVLSSPAPTSLVLDLSHFQSVVSSPVSQIQEEDSKSHFSGGSQPAQTEEKNRRQQKLPAEKNCISLILCFINVTNKLLGAFYLPPS